MADGIKGLHLNMTRDKSTTLSSVAKLKNALATAYQRIQVLEQALAGQEQENEQQKAALNAMAQSEQFLTRCAEIVQLGYAVWDIGLDRDITVSEELARIHGETKDAYLENVSSTEKYLEYVVPEDRQKYMDYENEVVVDKMEDIEYRITRTDGEIRHLKQYSAMSSRPSGQQVESLVVIQDITEQKRTERRFEESQQALKDSKVMLATTAALAHMGYAVWDYTNLNYAVVTEEYAGIFGYSKEEFQSEFADTEADMMLVHPEDRHLYQAYHDSGEEIPEFEYRIVRRDGDVRYVIERYDNVVDELGQISRSLVTIQDITETKLVNEHLIQSSKLATLGEMATGLVHELNQPLNVIRLAVENSLLRLHDSDLGPEYFEKKLKRIGDQVVRAAAIMDHLRVFGREASEPSELIEPDKAAMNALDLVREELRHSDIEITTTILQDCPLVQGHPIQLEQVLLNIFLNARDAMDENDVKKRLDLRIQLESNAVVIIVEDTGGGIPSDQLARIFEPFYTTKDVGKGTGLGLSIAYGIIQGMNGSIVAENYSIVDALVASKIHSGTRFIISLPLVE